MKPPRDCRICQGSWRRQWGLANDGQRTIGGQGAEAGPKVDDTVRSGRAAYDTGAAVS